MVDAFDKGASDVFLRERRDVVDDDFDEVADLGVEFGAHSGNLGIELIEGFVAHGASFDLVVGVGKKDICIVSRFILCGRQKWYAQRRGAALAAAVGCKSGLGCGCGLGYKSGLGGCDNGFVRMRGRRGRLAI